MVLEFEIHTSFTFKHLLRWLGKNEPSLTVINLQSPLLRLRTDDAKQLGVALRDNTVVQVLNLRISSFIDSEQEFGIDLIKRFVKSSNSLHTIRLFDGKNTKRHVHIVDDFLEAAAGRSSWIAIELHGVSYGIRGLACSLASQHKFDIQFEKTKCIDDVTTSTNAMIVESALKQRTSLYLKFDSGRCGLPWQLMAPTASVLTKLELGSVSPAMAPVVRQVLKGSPKLTRMTFQETEFRPDIMLPIMRGLQAKTETFKVTFWKCTWKVQEESDEGWPYESTCASLLLGRVVAPSHSERATARTRNKLFHAVLSNRKVRKVVVDSATLLSVKTRLDRRIEIVPSTLKPLHVRLPRLAIEDEVQDHEEQDEQETEQHLALKKSESSAAETTASTASFEVDLNASVHVTMPEFLPHESSAP